MVTVAQRGAINFPQIPPDQGAAGITTNTNVGMGPGEVFKDLAPSDNANFRTIAGAPLSGIVAATVGDQVQIAQPFARWLLWNGGNDVDGADGGMYLGVNKDAGGGPQPLLEPRTQQACSVASSSLVIAYNSEFGDAATEMAIWLNGSAVLTWNMTAGPSGVVSGVPSTSFTMGDLMAVQFVQGSAPGRVNLQVFGLLL